MESTGRSCKDGISQLLLMFFSNLPCWGKETDSFIVYSNLGKIELAEQNFRKALYIEASDVSGILKLL